MRKFGIILVSHGYYAEETLKSVEMIAGKQDRVIALALEENMSAVQLNTNMKNALDELKDECELILVLVDLYGGTPFNEVLRLSLEGEEFIGYTGFNLPLVLACSLSELESEKEIRTFIEVTMNESVYDINKVLEED